MFIQKPLKSRIVIRVPHTLDCFYDYGDYAYVITRLRRNTDPCYVNLSLKIVYEN